LGCAPFRLQLLIALFYIEGQTWCHKFRLVLLPLLLLASFLLYINLIPCVLLLKAPLCIAGYVFQLIVLLPLLRALLCIAGYVFQLVVLLPLLLLLALLLLRTRLDPRGMFLLVNDRLLLLVSLALLLNFSGKNTGTAKWMLCRPVNLLVFQGLLLDGWMENKSLQSLSLILEP